MKRITAFKPIETLSKPVDCEPLTKAVRDMDQFRFPVVTLPTSGDVDTNFG